MRMTNFPGVSPGNGLSMREPFVVSEIAVVAGFGVFLIFCWSVSIRYRRIIFVRYILLKSESERAGRLH